MQKLPRKFLASLSVFFLILGFMLVSVDFVALNRNFYHRQFAKNDVASEAELSQEELERVLDSLLAYFSGKANTLQLEVTFLGMDEPLPFYTEDELSHMHDVKIVFSVVRISGYVFTVLSIAALYLIIYQRKRTKTTKTMQIKMLSRAGIAGGTSFLIFIALIAIGVIFLFEPLFNFFHLIAFPQGNWQFDYNSNMLAVLPEALFQAAATTIALYGITSAAIIILLGILARLKLRTKS